MFKLYYTDEAKKKLQDLKKDGQLKKLRKIKSTLDKLQENPNYPGLHTHKYLSFKNKQGKEVFQSYIENKTPGAYRIFWHYGPDKEVITIITITPHP